MTKKVHLFELNKCTVLVFSTHARRLSLTVEQSSDAKIRFLLYFSCVKRLMLNGDLSDLRANALIEIDN